MIFSLPLVVWFSLSNCNCTISSQLSTPLSLVMIPSTISLRLAGRMPTWSPGWYVASSAKSSTNNVDRSAVSEQCRLRGLRLVVVVITFLLWYFLNKTSSALVSFTGTKRTVSMVSGSLWSLAIENDSSVSKQNVSQATYQTYWLPAVRFERNF